MKQLGKQSFLFPQKPVITAWASIAGKKESEGPLAHAFDHITKDNYFGQSTWEKAENEMQSLALSTLLKKAGCTEAEVGVVCSGDLLNQCTGSSFTLKNKNIPHLGLYGACSTMAQSLLVAGMCVDGGYFERAVAMTSSHFSTSERQYRFPLGYGGQRTPCAQWTVTGAGAAMLCAKGSGPRLTCATVGSIRELGIVDACNMGAAMAPAALATIRAHFEDTGTDASDYDLIVTGDLGQLGKDLLLTLSQQYGIYLGGRLCDCGTEVFDILKQDVHSGGSGCGCSALVLCSTLLKGLKEGRLKRILFCGTGALLSPTSTQQGRPIPGICHAVCIEGGNEWS